MAEVILRLHVDPRTGEKSLTVDYHSDADALPIEHEDEHKQLVDKVLEGQSGSVGRGRIRQASPVLPETVQQPEGIKESS